MSILSASFFRSLATVNISLGTLDTTSPYWGCFQEFQVKFNKQYTLAEIEDRFAVFRENYKTIEAHNSAANTTFTMGVNQFTDLTAEEFSNYVNLSSGKRRVDGAVDDWVSWVDVAVDSSGEDAIGSFGCVPMKNQTSYGVEVPVAFDWREKGVVSAVRNQGQCGSCWAFATTANAESVSAIHSGELLDLSEQYLVDCATGVGYFNQGCDGGNPDSALKYMIQHGQYLESGYPYVSGVTKVAGKCQGVGGAQDMEFHECVDVPAGNQRALLSAVVGQPVVVALSADSRYFQSYSSGIITSPGCSTTLNHAVEIVGYGVEAGIKYWTVRNSWDTTWGEAGYVRIARSDSVNDLGVCGIASEPSYLVI